MLKKIAFKVIFILSLICLIFGIYAANHVAINFNEPFLEVLIKDYSSFLILFIILCVGSYNKNIKILTMAILIESIWSYFFDLTWIIEWATNNLLIRIFYFINEKFIFFSGIASLCFLIVLILTAVLLGIRIKDYYQKQ